MASRAIVAVGLFILIREAGETLVAPEVPADAIALVKTGGGRVHILPHVLATLAAVIALGFLLGRAFRYIGQPPVIGEVVAGILLGPSLLGVLSPQSMKFLFPPQSLDSLGLLSQVGVVTFMFVVGMEFDSQRILGKAHAVILVSHVSILAPFFLGAVTRDGSP